MCSLKSLDFSEEVENKNIYAFEMRVKRVNLFDSVLMTKLKALNDIERGKVNKAKEEVQEADEGKEQSAGVTQKEEGAEKKEGDQDEASEGKPKTESEESEAPGNEVEQKLKDYIENVEDCDRFQKEGPDLLQKEPFDSLTEAFATADITGEFESDSDLDKSDTVSSAVSLDVLKFVEKSFEELGSRLKVVIPLYEANCNVEIYQEHFIDNVNELIAEYQKQGLIKYDELDRESRRQELKDPTGEDIVKFCTDLSTSDAGTIDLHKLPNKPVNIEALRVLSLRREIVISAPSELVNNITREPLIISILIERMISPMVLIGTSRLKFGQQFIDAIVMAATSAQKTSVVRRVKLPIRNNFDEQIGLLYLFVKLVCLGNYVPELEPINTEEEMPSNSKFDRSLFGKSLK